MSGFTFGNVTFGTQYSLFVNESKTYFAPEHSYEKIEVPGRNGDLLIDNNRFKNVTVTLDCFIKTNFKTNFRDMMNVLLSLTGYQKLILPGDTNHYRMGYLKGVVQAETTPFNKSGFFTLTFDCKPQRFRTSGDEEILLSAAGTTATITNPTRFLAKPIIINHQGGGMRVSANGNGFSLSYEPGTSSSVSGATVSVDCDLMTCASGTTNYFEYLSLTLGNGFPYLVPGENTISYNAYEAHTEYAIGIIPRYFDL